MQPLNPSIEVQPRTTPSDQVIGGDRHNKNWGECRTSGDMDKCCQDKEYDPNVYRQHNPNIFQIDREKHAYQSYKDCMDYNNVEDISKTKASHIHRKYYSKHKRHHSMRDLHKKGQGNSDSGCSIM